MIKLLLEKGADLESKDNDGRTPLSWAARNGQMVVMVLLKEVKVDVNAKYKYGQTPLSLGAGIEHWAFEIGHWAVVRMLLKTGTVEIDTTDKDFE